jgi:hypothetical protein
MALARAVMTPPQPRPLPPMFDTSADAGNECQMCAVGHRKQLKLLLPNGYQVCPVCDAPR